MPLYLKNGIYSIFIALSVWGLYLKTAPFTIVLIDGVEFALASHYVGVPHPSSYPLFVLLAKPFDLLPFGTIAYRCALASAFWGVGAIIAFFSLLRSWRIELGLASLSATVLGVSGLFWNQAVAAEVYTLNLLLLILLINIVSWHHPSRRLMYVFGFLFGLALSNHHLMLLAIPGLGLGFLYLYRRLLKVKTLVIALIFFTLGLSPYLLLPLRTIADTAITRGEPDNYIRFQEVVMKRVSASSKDMTQNKFDNLRFHWHQLREVWDFWIIPINPFLAIIGFFVIVYYFKNKGSLAIAFTGVLMTFVAMWTFYSRVQEIAFLIDPFFVPGMMISLFFVSMLFNVLIVKVIKHNILRLCTLFLVYVITILFMSIFNYYHNDKSFNNIAAGWARDALLPLPENTLLMASVDEYFPLLYMQLIEGYRPDIAVFHRVCLEYFPENWWERLPKNLRVFYPPQLQAPRYEESEIYEIAFNNYKENAQNARPLAISRYNRAFVPTGWFSCPQGLAYLISPDSPDVLSASTFLKSWKTIRFDHLFDKKVYVDAAERQFLANYIVSFNNTAGFLIGAFGMKEEAKWFLENTLQLDKHNRIATKILAAIKDKK